MRGILNWGGDGIALAFDLVLLFFDISGHFRAPELVYLRHLGWMAL